MSEQTLLALPEAPQPRSFTIEQVRALFESAVTALDAHPRLGVLYRGLCLDPSHARAALAAVYVAADADERRLLKTARALAQLLCAAEAHESRQPGKARAIALALPTGAEIAATAAIPISLLPQNQNQETTPL